MVANITAKKGWVLIGNRVLCNCPPQSAHINRRAAEDVSPLKALRAKGVSMILTTRDGRDLNQTYHDCLEKELELGETFSPTILSSEDLMPSHPRHINHKDFERAATSLANEGLLPESFPTQVFTVEGIYLSSHSITRGIDFSSFFSSVGEVPIPFTDGFLPVATFYIPAVVSHPEGSSPKPDPQQNKMFTELASAVGFLLKSPGYLDRFPAGKPSLVEIMSTTWLHCPSFTLTERLRKGEMTGNQFHRFIVHESLVDTSSFES